MTSIRLFDTTLRDGSQAEGISFSTKDKLRILQALDHLGIHYIEGGWPGSNPKDNQFFAEARQLKLKQARLTAFGSTRRKGIRASEDANLQAIVRAKVPVSCIFGKTWDLHVARALNTTLDENLRMIRDSVVYLKSKKLEVIYDAEHFFDGYRANPGYALKTLEAALAGGADNLTLCDTNGGSIPRQISAAVEAVREAFPRASLGIHCHNDSGCAVANTVAAVETGVTLVQGVMNGFGERCGNADLAVVIPDLQLKLGYPVLSDDQLRSLTETAHAVAEIANIVPNDRQPYVGHSAFAHKGGVHVSALARHVATYEHIDPALVGNQRRILISELSGKSNVLMKSKGIQKELFRDGKATQVVLDALKKKELEGYHYEGAEASFDLLVEKALGRYKPAFELESFRVSVENGDSEGLVTEATVKLKVNGRSDHTVAEGDGPVNALDNALRKALEKFYPSIRDMALTDYKVRVIDAAAGTAAKVRVLIESRDPQDEWTTTGVSTNLIEASWMALVDAIEYKLFKEAVKRRK
ncbi:MAG: citramalate synthase [Elusimicrobiota bacterium]|jgi:2-isopropylmalate synthase